MRRVRFLSVECRWGIIAALRHSGAAPPKAQILPHQSTSLNVRATSGGPFNIRTHAHIAGLPVGPLKPWKGYISKDIEAREAPNDTGGGRGIFAKTDLPFDREIIKVPALTYWIGNEDMRSQVREILKWVLQKFSENPDNLRPYIERNVFTLMKGGQSHFSSEDEVRRLVSDVPGASALLSQDALNTSDIARLAMRLQFSRFDIPAQFMPTYGHEASNTYKESGIALFPEIALFNHSCEPNVQLTFSMNESKEFIASARVLKPVKRGEQLFIQYIASEDMPISRFGAAMRKRWGFECGCPICRSRITSASIFVMVFFVFPIIYPVRNLYMKRLNQSAKNAGFT